jgi:hypothetical protein
MARITIDRKMIFLGYFSHKEAAAEAYNKAAIQYFKNYSRLNEVTLEKK